jgi:tricorn protease
VNASLEPSKIIQGYYRFPTLHGNTVVFASEDDLWTVPADGGVARRLTANLSAISHPCFSPMGDLLAFTAKEEGHFEVYTMPSGGGPLRRMTWLGATSSVMGWMPDGSRILFSSDAGQPFDRIGVVHAVSPEGGAPEVWKIGPAMSLSVAADGRIALGRNNNDPARWKRYRGGTAGEIWIDADGTGGFRRLTGLNGNMGRPMWIGDRIFFLSDHEGVGNLYSCTPAGGEVRRHTSHTDYYARFPSSDGRRIVYHAGADLYVYDPEDGETRRVEIAYQSPHVQRQRKFVDAVKHLETYAVHPQGHSLALTARGRSFTLGNWEGAVVGQEGSLSTAGRFVRRRLTEWLADGNRTVTVTDRDGEESLEIHSMEGLVEPVRMKDMDLGHPYLMKTSPVADHVALTNHRHEVVFVDLIDNRCQVVDRSEFRLIHGLSWSPDGRWLAYGFSISQYTTAIRIWDRCTNEIHTVTEPILHDTQPAFDPAGKYLYFLGLRELNPVYDNLHFELGFPKGMRPYLVTLRADLPSPFIPVPRPLEEDDPKDPGAKAADSKDAKAPAEVMIDFEGIERRVVAFPVEEGIYRQVAGLKGKKVLFSSFPVEGALGKTWHPAEPDAKGSLEVYDFGLQKQETLVKGITDFTLSVDGKTVVYRAGNKLRAIKAGKKDEAKEGDPEKSRAPGRESGWIDLGRVKIPVDPGAEWRQMAREAWRLQREHFWTADMSQVNWDAVWERYAPLIDRVGTRGELSDLLWEMQGELGTSHAYEMGGDHREEPSYPQGFLGADLAYDEESGSCRFAHVIAGAAGEMKADSPLRAPGVRIKAGDKLKAIDGQAVSRETPPAALLVHRAEAEVVLTVETAEGVTRDVTVTTLKSEFPARYREWVEANRRSVHEASDGRLGYVHIPDMQARGFAEFHRLYLAEVARDGLIVDVRFNRGGHVSQLLIEKLARKPVGYDVSRWGKPDPYPSFSVAGPKVALTNQWAGSDGDIFSHVFKLMNLGTLVGKRTWGGVIGIWPKTLLADGTVTTQPEYSFWFKDVGWGVENYGTDPDIEVEMAPQDYAHGTDPQLGRAIAVALEQLETEPIMRPAFDQRPNLSLPELR